MDNENDKVQYLIRYLNEYANAILKISPEYINVTVYGSGRRIYRERVYCYELYHQLRCRMNKVDIAFPYIIHGEMDKSGHSVMSGIPDFIIHQAGCMTENLLIIEVKHSDSDGIFDDINKLSRYVDQHNGSYYRGLSHVYGVFSEYDISSFRKMLCEKHLLLVHNTVLNRVEIYDNENLIYKLERSLME